MYYRALTNIEYFAKSYTNVFYSVQGKYKVCILYTQIQTQIPTYAFKSFGTIVHSLNQQVVVYTILKKSCALS